MDADYEGPWYFNIGESEKDYRDGANRRWEDNQQHGFVSAGRLAKSVREIKRLRQGSIIYGYLNAHGYVGFGRLVSDPVPALRLVLPSGTMLADSHLVDASILSYDDSNDDLREYAAGVQWFATVSRSEAKTYPGIFYFRGAVCKLTNAATLGFLREGFGDESPPAVSDPRDWLEAVLTRLRRTRQFPNAPETATKYYFDIKTGLPGVHYSLARKAESFKVGLYFETPDTMLNRRLFETVASQKQAIEAIAGVALEWRSSRSMKRCCVEVEHPADLGERPLRDLAVLALVKLSDACSGPLHELAIAAKDWR